MNSSKILAFQKLTTKGVLISLVVLCACGILTGESEITKWVGFITKGAICISATVSIVTIVYFFIRSVKEDMKK